MALVLGSSAAVIVSAIVFASAYSLSQGANGQQEPAHSTVHDPVSEELNPDRTEAPTPTPAATFDVDRMRYLKAVSDAVVELRRADELFARTLQEDANGAKARISSFDSRIGEVDEAVKAAQSDEYSAAARVQALKTRRLQFESDADPLSKYLTTYREYDDAVGATGTAEVEELEAELALRSAIARQHDLRDRLADLRAEYAASDNDDRAATQLAVGEGMEALESAAADVAILHEHLLEVTSSTMSAGENASNLAEALTRQRRNLDPSDERTAEFLEVVQIYEAALILKARASRVVRDARMAIEKSTRSSDHYVRPYEQQRTVWLRARRAHRSASVAAAELQRNVRATQRQVDAAENRRKEAREIERKARAEMLEARRRLDAEQAEERMMIRALTNAQRELATAVDEVRVAGKTLSDKADGMYEILGPVEKERLAAIQEVDSELTEAVKIRDHARERKARHAAAVAQLRVERAESERRQAAAEELLEALQHDTALPVLESAARDAAGVASARGEFRRLRAKMADYRASIARARALPVRDSAHERHAAHRQELLRHAAAVISDFEKACQAAEIAMAVSPSTG